MMVAFVLGEVAAYQMGMTVWFIIAAVLFLFHRKLRPMKQKTLREDAHSREAETCRRRPRETPECAKAHSFSHAVIKTAEGRGDSDFQTDAERVWNWKDPMMCRVLLLFFCFLAGWGRMTVEMRPDALERMVTQKGGSAEVAVSGILDSISEKNGWCTMVLTGVEVEDESVRKVLISCKSDLLEKCEEKILPPCGSQIHLTGTAEFLEEARNPGQFSYRMYYRGLGIRNRVTADQIVISEGKSSPLRSQAECFRAYATAVFQEICVPEDAGIFQAILLGDKSGLSEELRERFQDNGIAHILAVSGLHVSLIGMSVYSALRFWGISYGWAGLGASALLTFYGFVTGFGASVFRAVFMVEVSCLAAYLGRSYDLLSALSLSLILQAWQSPYLLFSAGLQLSYGAVAAIGLETERLRKVGKKRKGREEEEQEKEKKKGYETLMLSLAIQLYTMPIQLYHYFTFPMLGIFLNLIVIPLLTYAAGSGLLALGIYSIAFAGGKIGGMGIGSSIAGVLSAFWGAASGISGMSEIPEVFRIAASACTGPGHYIFQLYEWLCIQVERVPFHSIVAGRPEMWKIGVFYVALGIRYVWSVGEAGDNLERKGFFLFSKDWNAQGKNSVFIAVAVVFLVVQPVHGFQIWFLDVGQGDGVFLQTRDEAILSDCGSSQDKKIGKNVLEPFLKSQGIRTLDWILVSHADADHTNGIEWLLKEEADIRVRNLALPVAGKGQEAYEKLETLARKRGAEVYYLHQGETVRAKRLALRCLYPEAGEKPAEERNSHSLVFDVRYGKFSMLLTGDIGVEDEREILEMEEDKKGEKVTLLKAAHHGSNGSSSEEFLECFSPAFTVLSYGEGNTYGHPAPEAVERLEQTGTEIWRTPDSGAVNVWTDGKRMYIKGYKKQDE